MSRLLAKGAVLCLLASMLVAAGCAQSTPAEKKPSGAPAPAETKPAEAKPELSKPASRVTYQLGTASTSGSMYAWATAVCALVNSKQDKIELVPAATAGPADNIEAMRKGTMKMGLLSTEWMEKAYTGDGMPKFEGLRVLYGAYGGYWHLIVRKANPATSIYDLKGKRVSFSNKGSGTYDACTKILPGLGLRFEDFKAVFIPTEENKEAFKDGQLDAVVYITGMPHPATTDLASTVAGGIKLLSLSDEDIKKISSKHKSLVPSVIPAGTYPGVDYDVKGVGVARYLGCTADLQDEHAYLIAKIITENHDELVKAVAGAAETTPDLTIKGDAVCPVHPGVAKYFREKGLMK